MFRSCSCIYVADRRWRGAKHPLPIIGSGSCCFGSSTVSTKNHFHHPKILGPPPRDCRECERNPADRFYSPRGCLFPCLVRSSRHACRAARLWSPATEISLSVSLGWIRLDSSSGMRDHQSFSQTGEIRSARTHYRRRVETIRGKNRHPSFGHAAVRDPAGHFVRQHAGCVCVQRHDDALRGHLRVHGLFKDKAARGSGGVGHEFVREHRPSVEEDWDLQGVHYGVTFSNQTKSCMHLSERGSMLTL